MITNVTSSTSNGTYNENKNISIQVTFDQTVTVTGTPQLELETGSTDQKVDYSSGSGSDELTFTYTVQEGDESADLDYKSVGSLTLNDGTIEGGGQDANLILPSPGASGSLGANKALVIDGVAPTIVSITSNTANGTYGIGDAISIILNFSEAVDYDNSVGNTECHQCHQFLHNISCYWTIFRAKYCKYPGYF
ncbi:MAG: hypothetical protein HEP71_33735 [Roseivirga sp.]|nr:hypothetical protein [Roseivirga sp.]